MELCQVYLRPPSTLTNQQIEKTAHRVEWNSVKVYLNPGQVFPFVSSGLFEARCFHCILCPLCFFYGLLCSFVSIVLSVLLFLLVSLKAGVSIVFFCSFVSCGLLCSFVSCDLFETTCLYCLLCPFVSCDLFETTCLYCLLFPFVSLTPDVSLVSLYSPLEDSSSNSPNKPVD